jgi:chromatin structure-remodeling complex subunit SFH1
MRTGVTALVQPETISGGAREREIFMAEYEREVGSGTSTPRDSPFGRRRKINYADKGSDESESSLSELDSDPEDDNYGGGGKRAREAGRRVMDQQAVQRMGRMKRKKDEMDKGWTWLGDRTPGERVTAVGVRGGRHRYL